MKILDFKLFDNISERSQNELLKLDFFSKNYESGDKVLGKEEDLNYAMFIDQGCLKACEYTINGKEIVSSYYFAGDAFPFYLYFGHTKKFPYDVYHATKRVRENHGHRHCPHEKHIEICSRIHLLQQACNKSNTIFKSIAKTSLLDTPFARSRLFEATNITDDACRYFTCQQTKLESRIEEVCRRQGDLYRRHGNSCLGQGLFT